MPEPPLQSLLNKIAEGDEAAFQRLFEQYWGNIYGVALTFTKSRVLAEEIVQDVFLKIWLTRERLVSVEKFDSYLFTIARNHVFNELRKKIQEEYISDSLPDQLEETAHSPEEQLLLKDYELLVNKVIEQLPLQQRRVYSLSRHKGLSQEEIAAALQISRNTVKSHMNKALQTIRTYLKLHAKIEAPFIFVIFSTFFDRH